MLDVHAPHGRMEGFKDFLLHLFTITVGLLIALSLEGTVEWFHHRHLVHEAEASLYNEISNNSKGLAETEADIKKQQGNLRHNVASLKIYLRDHKFPEHDQMEITFHVRTFESVSWKAAQSTGALALMPYDAAQEYSEIYTTQGVIDDVQRVAARDAILSMAPFQNLEASDPDLRPDQAEAIKAHIEILQAQLSLLNSFVTGLDGEYKKFLSSHAD